MERYTAEDIKANRELLIQLRDEALKQGDMEWSIVLSHSISMLFQLLGDEEELAARCVSFVPAIMPFDAPFDTEARD